ncbi:MAG: DMT family transporter [Tannerella sp.]|jgi:drug/metabolite transporter (DMT)-like permease|nr:DMT family transporter [Tannerella sp.]
MFKNHYFCDAMNRQNTLIYHLAALVTVIIWGITMVSTKILLREGLSPEEIMMIRFAMAYIFLWILYPRSHRIKSWLDELIFAGIGITSGSLYFFLENTALVYTPATNVSLFCALIPLTTAIFTHFVFREKSLTKRFRTGSVISLAGTVLIILNGKFSFKVNPLGDFLALMAIISWSVYGVLVKCLTGNYNSLFVTRKIFFYGILTMLPCFMLVAPFDVPAKVLVKPVVLGNLCFLGLIASSLCYLMWMLSLRNLGVVKTNNYIYFSPLVTIITAHFVISEHITPYVICGTILILSGLWIATAKSTARNHKNGQNTA